MEKWSRVIAIAAIVVGGSGTFGAPGALGAPSGAAASGDAGAAPAPTPAATPTPTPTPSASPPARARPGLTRQARTAPKPTTPPPDLSPEELTGPVVGPEPPKGPPPEYGIENKRWGGTLSVGFPHPVWVDADYLASRSFTFAIGGGGLKIPIKGDSGAQIELGIGALDVRARWHPMHGAFFVGLGMGYQSISGQASDTISFSIPQIQNIPASGPYSIKATIDASISSPYFTPQFGWFWVFETGFCIGFDFGLQVPFAPKTTISLTTDNVYANDVLGYLKQLPQYQSLQNQVQDAGNKVGKILLPYTTLLRLGWMF